MELDIIPGNMEVALKSEVEELRNQIQTQKELIFQMLQVLKTKFPEEFTKDETITGSHNL